VGSDPKVGHNTSSGLWSECNYNKINPEKNVKSFSDAKLFERSV